MLEKLQETLKSESASLVLLKLLKIQQKPMLMLLKQMDECKQKVVEIEKLTDTINSLKEKRQEFWFWLLIFFLSLSEF